jgi:thioredoxin reductase (NADPH)
MPCDDLSQEILLLPPLKPKEIFDAIIVGAGPAGLSAAIYLSRANLKTLVLEAEKLGGKLLGRHLIQNYPGFQSIQSLELAEKMVRQAEESGAKILYPARAVDFELAGNSKTVRTRDREFYGRKIVLAMGVQRKKLEIPGAEDLLGLGVSYCPICDGSLWKGKKVALIGDDEETIEDGLYLSNLVDKIYLIPGSVAPKYTQKSSSNLLSKGKVTLLDGYEVTEISGRNCVEKVIIKQLKDRKEQEIDVSAVFISGTKTPVIGLLSKFGVETDSTGCIKVDKNMETNIRGVYAVGDVTCDKKYQVATSVGQGATAALHIIQMIHASDRQ